ncbi:MAG: hypothetical protein AAF633_04085 [Chloroflexota bacterium]
MKPQLKSFLLRFKRIDGESNWRVTAQNVETGEQRHFSSEVEALFYLFRVLTEEEKNEEGPNQKKPAPSENMDKNLGA